MQNNLKKLIYLFLILIVHTESLISFEISITDKNSIDKAEVINKMLQLQASLLVNPYQPIPESKQKTGFLMIAMKPESVLALLEEKHGVIITAQEHGLLMGYVLITDFSEFTDLYEPEHGYIDTTWNMHALEIDFAKEGSGYIEQIGVDPNCARMGVGTQLINTCKELKPICLVSDVFIHPVINNASLSFFDKKGFIRFGIIYENPRDFFPYPHQTQAFIWQGSQDSDLIQ